MRMSSHFTQEDTIDDPNKTVRKGTSTQREELSTRYPSIKDTGAEE